MKSRRLTIFCVALIALAGTPRAWQEVSKLLAAAQHKAQVKFWSMVLPGARESGQAEMLMAAETPESSSVEVASNCPLPRTESWGNQSARSSKANRRMIPVSVQTEAEEQLEIAPASHAGLIARSLKAPRGDSRAESLVRTRSLPEIAPTAIAVNTPAHPALPSAATLPHQPASKSDTFRFVLMPPAYPATSSFVEKEAVIQLKMLRKSVEAGKLLKQKGRFPVGNGTAAFPSS